MHTFTIKILPNEYWYGGAVYDSTSMPYGEDTEFSTKLLKDNKYNQVNTTLISSKGRYAYSDGFDMTVSGGVITLFSPGEVTFGRAGETLKDAYLYVMQTVFPVDGKLPAKEFFTKAQFNDWIELGRWKTQAQVESYAKEVAESGYPYAIYMIDSEWANHYGALRFDPEKFHDPKKMLDTLNALGFKVLVWESPFITPDSPEFRELKEKDLLVKSADGKIAVREWWDGISALLDMSNPAAVEWLKERNEKLLAMGVCGFKLDAGDVEYYRDDDITFGGVTARGQCKTYAEFGLNYAYHELRAGYNVGGKGINQRQADKWHRWEKPGLAAIVPEIIGMGLMGYFYTCPDMVGGGSIGQIGTIDEELFVRYAAASALMPMIQFSALPWRFLSPENNEICKKFALLHEEFGEYIYALAKNAAKTGEPITRHLAYEFPNEGFEREMNVFMLGSEYLVAPVLKKGERTKTLRLPSGKWQYFDGKTFDGGKEVTVTALLDTLPYFKKI